MRLTCARCDRTVEVPDGAIAILGEFVCAACRARQREAKAAAVARRSSRPPPPPAQTPDTRRAAKEVDKLTREIASELEVEADHEPGPLSAPERAARLDDLRGMAAPPSGPRGRDVDAEIASLSADYFGGAAPAEPAAEAPEPAGPVSVSVSGALPAPSAPRASPPYADLVQRLRPRAAWLALGALAFCALIAVVAMRRGPKETAAAPPDPGPAAAPTIETASSPAAATPAATPAPPPTEEPEASEPAPSATSTASHHAATASAPSTAPTAAPAAGTGEFDKQAAGFALSSAASRASSCRRPGDSTGGAKVRVTFAPTGRATQAVVDGGSLAGTPVGSCVARVFQGAHVPPFTGGPVVVTKSVALR